jgi:hypothetical protein
MLEKQSRNGSERALTIVKSVTLAARATRP